MENILIRTATLDDLERLLEFEQALIKAERPFDKTIREDPVSYYDIKQYILDPEAEVLVAEIDGNVVSSGFGLIRTARPYLDHGQYAYLGFMFTMPEYRGRGINRLIIDGLKKWAVRKGLQEVRLSVYPKNQAAVKAYEKVGFVSHLLEMRLLRPSKN